MPPHTVRPTRFLLAEDDDDHAELVTRTFARKEPAHRLDRVNDGEAALRFLTRQSPYEQAERPEVVLLDLNLPRLSGHEVLAAMKADEELRLIPVVVLTSSEDGGDRRRAYQRHANSYVVKPLNFLQFQQLIRDLCDYWGGWDSHLPTAPSA
ncbi:response regulator [Alienimonas californiensis]|uniref:Response regulator rcp1 n=1 Tax=Alienimonas californiensis TaxID=2527989 RepID=A0A517PBE2_9PLAN|nr:response regulator [Alienimonas californiensis]QDT16703.1 Response regulator rcp1 [Alienimonas californiensis]